MLKTEISGKNNSPFYFSIFVFFIYFFYHSSCHKDQFTVSFKTWYSRFYRSRSTHEKNKDPAEPHWFVVVVLPSQVYVKGVPFVNRGYTKLVPFLSRLRGWTSGRPGASSYKILLILPGIPGVFSKQYQFSLLLRRFVFRTVEAKSKRQRLVMNREGPWEGYRRQAKRRLTRCLLSAFLCPHIFFERETSGYEVDINSSYPWLPLPGWFSCVHV